MQHYPLVPWALSALLVAGCGGGGSGMPSDAGVPSDADPALDAAPPSDARPPADGGPLYRRWQKVELDGTVCGNGSQYKFFVNLSDTSDNLLVYFEPGGACWDFDSCAGRSGIRGAANPDGISDDHMDFWQLGSPLLRRDPRVNPAKEWNLVFIPYCTGDVHTGDRVITYEDPRGEEPPLEWHHKGRANMKKVIDWLDERFPTVPKMLATGCSAGGTGSLANYFFLRNGIEGVERGYLLSDSGPVFPMSDNSAPLHDKIRDSWGIDQVVENGLAAAGVEVDFTDLGEINRVIAEQFPEDRLASTYFRLDYNYSLYSYERFYDYPPREEIYRLWWEDTQLLMEQYDRFDNLAYYIPFWRELNDSHCLTIVTWDGTEIESEGMDLEAYVEHLLDDSEPLQSYLEETPEGPYADIAP